MKDNFTSETEELKARIEELESELAKAKAAGRECESRYRSILNLSQDGIVIVSAEAVLTEVNERFCEWTGFAREELIQSPAMHVPFLSPESLKKVISVIKRRLSGEDVPPYDLPILTKSGDTVFGEVHATVLYDSLGVAVADMIVLRDVTERKKRESDS